MATAYKHQSTTTSTRLFYPPCSGPVAGNPGTLLSCSSTPPLSLQWQNRGGGAQNQAMGSASGVHLNWGALALSLNQHKTFECECFVFIFNICVKLTWLSGVLQNIDHMREVWLHSENRNIWSVYYCLNLKCWTDASFSWITQTYWFIQFNIVKYSMHKVFIPLYFLHVCYVAALYYNCLNSFDPSLVFTQYPIMTKQKRILELCKVNLLRKST